MRIFTGNYENCRMGDLVSISGDKGKSVGFTGNSYTKLAPKKEFWKIWHDNIGKISEEENNKFYMKEFYKNVLANLNPEDVVKDLGNFGNNVVLLCYEDNQDFCHRQLVATWLERKLQVDIPEISIGADGNIEILERNSKYVNDFSKIMDSIEQGNAERDR